MFKNLGKRGVCILSYDECSKILLRQSAARNREMEKLYSTVYTSLGVEYSLHRVLLLGLRKLTVYAFGFRIFLK
jgi:hypothetical protein